MLFPDPIVDAIGNTAVESDDLGRDIVAKDDKSPIEFPLENRGKRSIPTTASIEHDFEDGQSWSSIGSTAPSAWQFSLRPERPGVRRQALFLVLVLRRYPLARIQRGAGVTILRDQAARMIEETTDGGSHRYMSAQIAGNGGAACRSAPLLSGAGWVDGKHRQFMPAPVARSPQHRLSSREAIRAVPTGVRIETLPSEMSASPGKTRVTVFAAPVSGLNVTVEPI